jgi:hypothetical protein
MSAKPTGLAAFTRNRGAEAAEAAGDKPATPRKRAQGETVALTVRLPRADWVRLHQLAVAEGVSLQTLATIGLSKVFAEHGLPPMQS